MTVKQKFNIKEPTPYSRTNHLVIVWFILLCTRLVRFYLNHTQEKNEVDRLSHVSK